MRRHKQAATMAPMNETTATPTTSVKHELHRKLHISRAAVLSKLDGLSEYDLRRPMTPTGTNLLGLVKHLASMEYGYLGETFDRPPPSPASTSSGSTGARARMATGRSTNSTWMHRGRWRTGQRRDAQPRWASS